VTWQTARNRTSERVSHGFWASGWGRSDGRSLNATVPVEHLDEVVVELRRTRRDGGPAGEHLGLPAGRVVRDAGQADESEAGRTGGVREQGAAEEYDVVATSGEIGSDTTEGCHVPGNRGGRNDNPCDRLSTVVLDLSGTPERRRGEGDRTVWSCDRRWVRVLRRQNVDNQSKSVWHAGDESRTMSRSNEEHM
jgi:hypothetical protein